MGVVSAGVHHPVHLRDEGVIILLLYGQRVNVRPQGHGLARSTPFYHAEHTRLRVARGKWNAVFLQLLLHRLRGGVFLPADFRELVDMAPQGNDLFPVSHLDCIGHRRFYISPRLQASGFRYQALTSGWGVRKVARKDHGERSAVTNSKPVGLWAVPRSVSTALERVFVERGDF